MHGLSRSEQYSLIVVILLIIGGLGFNAYRADAPDPALVSNGDGQWRQLAEVDADQGLKLIASGAAAEGTATVAPLDLNTATVDQLDAALPGIGEVKAQSIIEYRDQMGGFHSVEQLLEVNGIGPATFQRLQPLITIGQPAAVPAVTPPAEQSIPQQKVSAEPPAPTSFYVNPNTADAATLQQLHGIGEVLAGRIIRERLARGPYRRPEDLQRVSGIGPKTVAGMRHQLIFE